MELTTSFVSPSRDLRALFLEECRQRPNGHQADAGRRSSPFRFPFVT